MKKPYLILIAVTAISFAISAYFYPQMPDTIASHWNAQGEANGYMSKFWGLFLMPMVSSGLLFLLVFIPKLDPLKANIAKFRKHFDFFIILMSLFLLYVHILSILWNIDVKLNMTVFLIPAMSVLFFYIGILLENSKRNWFIGIRTPWTLSSDLVWEKTHKKGAKLFKAMAIVMLFGIYFLEQMVYFIVFPVIFIILYTFIYSYLEYQKEKK